MTPFHLAGIFLGVAVVSFVGDDVDVARAFLGAGLACLILAVIYAVRRDRDS